MNHLPQVSVNRHAFGHRHRESSGVFQPLFAKTIQLFKLARALALRQLFAIDLGKTLSPCATTSLWDANPGQTTSRSSNARSTWPGHAHAVLRPHEYISTAEKAEIDAGTKHIWLCGIARYRDVFERRNSLRKRANLHETKVCLRYMARSDGSTGMWVLGGPSGYNEAK